MPTQTTESSALIAELRRKHSIERLEAVTGGPSVDETPVDLPALPPISSVRTSAYPDIYEQSQPLTMHEVEQRAIQSPIRESVVEQNRMTGIRTLPPDIRSRLALSEMQAERGALGAINPQIGGLPGAIGIESDPYGRPGFGERMFVESAAPYARIVGAPIAQVAGAAGLPGTAPLAEVGPAIEEFQAENPPQSKGEAALGAGLSTVGTTAAILSPSLPGAAAHGSTKLLGRVLPSVARNPAARMATGVAGFTAGEAVPEALYKGESVTGALAESAISGPQMGIDLARAPEELANALSDPDLDPRQFREALRTAENLAVIAGLELAGRAKARKAEQASKAKAEQIVANDPNRVEAQEGTGITIPAESLQELQEAKSTPSSVMGRPLASPSNAVIPGLPEPPVEPVTARPSSVLGRPLAGQAPQIASGLPSRVTPGEVDSAGNINVGGIARPSPVMESAPEVGLEVPPEALSELQEARAARQVSPESPVSPRNERPPFGETSPTRRPFFMGRQIAPEQPVLQNVQGVMSNEVPAQTAHQEVTAPQAIPETQQASKAEAPRVLGRKIQPTDMERRIASMSLADFTKNTTVKTRKMDSGLTLQSITGKKGGLLDGYGDSSFAENAADARAHHHGRASNIVNITPEREAQIDATMERLERALGQGQAVTDYSKALALGVPKEDALRILDQASPSEARPPNALNVKERVAQKLKDRQESPAVQVAQEGQVATSPQAPQEVEARIKKVFPSSEPRKVTINYADGQRDAYAVKLPNGKEVLIEPDRDRITFDAERVAKSYGRPKAFMLKQTANGKYKSQEDIKSSGFGIIELLKDADAGTLSHEKFHAMMDLVLTEGERASVIKRFGTEEKAAEAFRRKEGFTRDFTDKAKGVLTKLRNIVSGDPLKDVVAKLEPAISPPRPSVVNDAADMVVEVKAPKPIDADKLLDRVSAEGTPDQSVQSFYKAGPSENPTPRDTLEEGYDGPANPNIARFTGPLVAPFSLDMNTAMEAVSQYGPLAAAVFAGPLMRNVPVMSAYAERLINKVERQGGQVGKSVAQMARNAVDHAGQVEGPIHDRVVQFHGKYAQKLPIGERKAATDELMKVDYTPTSISDVEAGFARIQSAAEPGRNPVPAPSLSFLPAKELREGLDIWKDMIVEGRKRGVQLTDRAGNPVPTEGPPPDRFARVNTPELHTAFKTKNFLYSALEQVLPELNNMTPKQVTDLMEQIRDPLAERTIGSLEIVRSFPVFPTHLKIKGKTYPILETNPTRWLQGVTRHSASRIGFIQEFGQRTSGKDVQEGEFVRQVRDLFVRAGGKESDFTNLVASLHDRPVGPQVYVRGENPDSFSNIPRRLLMGVVDPVVNQLQLTTAGVLNFFEPFVRTPTIGGYHRFGKAQVRLMEHPVTRNRMLRQLGAATTALMDFRLEPGRRIEQVGQILSRGIGIINNSVNEMGERAAGMSGVVLMEDLMKGRTHWGDKGDLRRLDYTDAQIEQLMGGTASQELYNSIPRRTVAYGQGGNLRKAQKSLAANSSLFGLLMPFQSYAQLSMRFAAEMQREISRSIKERDAKGVLAHTKRLGELLFNANLAGASQLLVLSLLTGRDTDRSDESWPEYITNNLTATLLGGPLTSLRMLTEGRLSTDGIFNALSAKYRVFNSAKDALFSQGRYRDMSGWDRPIELMKSVTPLTRVQKGYMSLVGLHDVEMQSAVGKYWEWYSKKKGGLGEAGQSYDEFKGNMRRAYDDLRNGRVEDADGHISLAFSTPDELGLPRTIKDAREFLSRKKLLPSLNSKELQELRTEVGDRVFHVLQGHDAILSEFAWKTGASARYEAMRAHLGRKDREKTITPKEKAALTVLNGTLDRVRTLRDLADNAGTEKARNANKEKLQAAMESVMGKVLEKMEGVAGHKEEEAPRKLGQKPLPPKHIRKFMGRSVAP